MKLYIIYVNYADCTSRMTKIFCKEENAVKYMKDNYLYHHLNLTIKEVETDD